MAKDTGITQWFGVNLAEDLTEKIKEVYPEFDGESYCKHIEEHVENLGYTKRVELHADALRAVLPDSYPRALEILMGILGEENPNETGMFTDYYWIMPVGKFIEKYGLEDFEVSMGAIEEVTKRNTGEYAIRPFIRRYPEDCLRVMTDWSLSSNFHLRRLASEGLRPKLPWATKLDSFIERPQPVFDILANLMEDPVKFVQKSVANHLTDYLKVNEKEAVEFIRKYQASTDQRTQWIIKHATRKIKPEGLF